MCPGGPANGGEGGVFLTAAKGEGQQNFNHVWGEGHFFSL